MSEIASGAVNGIWVVVRSVIYDRVKTYLSYVQNYERNLNSLSEELEELCLEKKDVDVKVLSGKDRLEKLTFKAAHWLARVQDLSKDEEMKKLMTKDIGIAKAMSRLMKNADLKKLVEMDGEMRDLVVKVMKDIVKRKGQAENGEALEVEESGAEEKDKEVGQVLEKLVEETMDEFKTLMQNGPYMAVAALHLLENHMENLERLTEKDKEVADIIAKAREMSHEEEWLSPDNDDNVLVRENTLRKEVTNLVKPVGEVLLNEELLKALPENLSLGMEAMGVVIGNSRGLKAELMDADNTSKQRNCCCCVIPFSYFSDRHDMSVAAESMLNKITDIIKDKSGDRDLTWPIRTEDMEAIPTNSVGLKSRNELLLKIVKALTHSDVQAVGVFGMGGSGFFFLSPSNNTDFCLFVISLMAWLHTLLG
ncbi:uncharacterized protein LOC141590632 [Silene latifolia]|uniref:uncharacterized protein LOC141590632 n=1 Tax=Silene latifolia TaxID=37657 RepID=UPI003D76CF57